MKRTNVSKKMVATPPDIKIKCVCGCGNKLGLLHFGDGQVAISIYVKGKIKPVGEVVVDNEIFMEDWNNL